jgi:predicted ATPase
MTRPTQWSGAPWLRSVASLEERFEHGRHPFNVRAFSNGINLQFKARVAFFVGENGSGKSTGQREQLLARSFDGHTRGRTVAEIYQAVEMVGRTRHSAVPRE